VLDLHGKLLVVGLPKDEPHVNPFELIKNRRSIVGSMIGGTVKHKRCLIFAQKKILYPSGSNTDTKNQ
jgi:D-arabinose 1-dehydrogenase-like Zn-dependent alcohol dehydrogenase